MTDHLTPKELQTYEKPNRKSRKRRAREIKEEDNGYVERTEDSLLP